MTRPDRQLPRLLLIPLLLSLPAGASEHTETNSLGMTLRLVEGGRYLRGSDARENGLAKAFPLSVNAQYFGNAETPAHVTWITKPYWIGETEVTVGQWKAFVAATGHVTSAERSGEGIVGWSPTPVEAPLYQSHDFERKAEFTWKNPGFPQSDDHPVVGVSWEDARAFLTWLGKQEGAAYRLPTEAEWEFACRAGTTTWFSFGDEPRGIVHRHANLGNVELEQHRKHAAERQWLLDWDRAPTDGHLFTAPVGSYQPDPLGLRDLHGNVWEWCTDLWLDTHYHHWEAPERGKPRGFAVDPVNESEAQTDTNRFRSIRGGCWYNGPILCRSSNRAYWDESDAACYLGFRVVREADPTLSTAAREAHASEQAALDAVRKAGGEIRSPDGLALEIEIAGDSLYPAILPELARIPDLEALVLHPKNTTSLTTADLEAIARIATLRRLIFRGSFDFTNADLGALAKSPQLEDLSFSRSTALHDAMLARLAPLRGLKYFRCYGTGGGLTDAGIIHLAGNRGLELLELNETHASGAFLEAFTNCPLTSLTLTSPLNAEPGLTDANAARLAAFPALRRLHLNGQGRLGDPSLLVIRQLTRLDELGLHGCAGFSAGGFSPLGKLTALRTLNLQGTTAGDVALGALSTIPRLQSLRLGSRSAAITDTGLTSLSELISLESLYLETCDATDAGIAALGRINRLKTLDLGAPGITGDGLGPVARLPELNDLRLRCPALTDVVFEHLARAKSLRKLRLVERGWRPPAALTDSGLLAIAPATWLTELWLPRDDSGLSEAGMKALEPLMPRTRVIPYTVEWKRETP